METLVSNEPHTPLPLDPHSAASKVQPANANSSLPQTGDNVVVHCNASILKTNEMIDSVAITAAPTHVPDSECCAQTKERCQAVDWCCGQGHAIPALEEVATSAVLMQAHDHVLQCVRQMRKGQKCSVKAPASLCFGEKATHRLLLKLLLHCATAPLSRACSCAGRAYRNWVLSTGGDLPPILCCGHESPCRHHIPDSGSLQAGMLLEVELVDINEAPCATLFPSMLRTFHFGALIPHCDQALMARNIRLQRERAEVKRSEELEQVPLRPVVHHYELLMLIGHAGA